MQTGDSTQDDEITAATWLSEGLEVLIAELAERAHDNTEPDFDVVIIGSGYGGSIAASRLAWAEQAAGVPLKVCLLERGKEYLAGMFPASVSSLAGHLRTTTPRTWNTEQEREQGGTSAAAEGLRDGLFDVRVDDDYNVLVANGLGGGSLINAGVMETPPPGFFETGWPREILEDTGIMNHYRDMTRELGATDQDGRDNTIALHEQAQRKPLKKHSALKKLASGSPHAQFRDAAITVAMQDGDNDAGVRMRQCTLCGDCATGCNMGAKISLDLNLLPRARRREGMRIVTGATVLTVTPAGEFWNIEVVHTLPTIAAKEDGASILKARRVIIAAGALGSTEILMRSKAAGLGVSGQLGQRFSGNGDMIAVGYNMETEINAVADEADALDARSVGPTITGVVDCRAANPDHPVVIEDMAVPGAMRWVFEELYTTVNSLRQLATVDWRTHGNKHPDPDPLSVDRKAIQHSQVYAVIGDDGADGVLEFRDDFIATSDGAITINWPSVRSKSLFPAQIDQLEALASDSGSGGSIIPNPLWRPLPDNLEFLSGGARGPLMTVHPLGGCSMADSGSLGVVNHCGQVFKGDEDEVHHNLVVLDGAILPRAVGTNPALTIAALCARAMPYLLRDWNYTGLTEETGDQFRQRPHFDHIAPPAHRQRTEMQFAERLRGPLTLKLDGVQREYIAELTLFFKDKALHELTAARDQNGGLHTLTVADRSAATHKRSQLRLFDLDSWTAIDQERLSGRELEQRLEAASLLTAPLRGSLTILARERSNVLQRTWRALCAYFGNRGWRDLYQSRHPLKSADPADPCTDKHRQETAHTGSIGWSGLKHLSRAGEIRLFEYELTLDTNCTTSPLAAQLREQDKRIHGYKRIGYRRRGNPLRQLMEVDLDAFPHLVKERPARLVLRPEFLARKGLPLFRISKQENLALALTEVGSLAAYFLRLLLNTHLLSLRAPDAALPRVPQRLPGAVPGLPDFEIHGRRIAERPEGVPSSHEGDYRLTRYPAASSQQPPVLMIHGYSASGTTFAHHAVNPNLASFLWHRGRDVWILDMRSSCGMPTSRRNFSFEELAYADIPLAVEEVCEITGAEKIDVVAHCMGSAMLSMAVLTAANLPEDATYPEQHSKLPQRINRLVMSQVGPLVCLAPENVFRAYAFSYLKHFLPLDQYQFAPSGGSVDKLLDRALAVLPYSDEEYDLENPRERWKRTPWTRTRHRMDLLYGRTFSLKNLAPHTLEHIDDLFGPLSVDTATQVLHFARYQTITDHSGNNIYVSRDQLASCWTFPTLSVHGRDNGLSWRGTLGRLQRLLREDAGRSWRSVEFDDFGHQDSLIGRGAEKVFVEIASFLDDPDSVDPVPPARSLLLQPPWSGPVMSVPPNDRDAKSLSISFGVNPALSKPRLLLTIPLRDHQFGHQLVYDNGNDSPAIQLQALDPEDIRYNWCRVDVAWPDTPAGHDRVLLLLVYNESPLLDNAVFGKEPANIDEFIGARELDPDSRWLADEQLAMARSALGDGSECLQERVHELLMEGAHALRHGILRLPDRHGDQLVIAAGSCQFPPGILDQWPGFNSYFRLASGCYASDFPHPDLLVLPGDQIYVDSTAGIFDPSALDERYQHPYQRFYRSSAARAALREVPACMMLDDHEIVDNWEPLPNDPENWQRHADGLDYFRVFQRDRHRAKAAGLWYAFQRKGYDFFMLDSRSERSHRTSASTYKADMLFDAARPGENRPNQWQDLKTWLEQEPLDRPRFLVCPSMPFPQERRAITGREHYDAEGQQARRFAAAMHSDSWTGYPDSQARLLELIRDSKVRNLVMINGDAHLGCIAEVWMEGSEFPFWAVHASALYAPLPFANARRADLAGCEEFVLPRGIRGKVYTEFAPPGDGFAILTAQEDGAAWKIEVSYDREGVAASQAWRRQIPLQSCCGRPVP